MGDEGDDDVPTGLAATELGAAIDETEAHTAWSLDGGWDEPQRRPGWIVAAAVVAAVVAVAITGALAWVQLRPAPAQVVAPSVAGASARSTVTVEPKAPDPSPPPAPEAAPLPPRPLAPVTLPMDPYGQVHVRTLSGQTVCAMTAGDVQCNVHFTNRLGPNHNGMAASGVGINSRGAFQWLYGDPGDPNYVTLAYGTVYHALGWIINPTSDGTTFMYDATGHGMTVSVDGFSTF
jgi:hypothetical protein